VLHDVGVIVTGGFTLAPTNGRRFARPCG